MPYAIRAKFAHPDRAGFALVGNSAFQMNDPAELITVAKTGKMVRPPAST